MVNKGYRDFAGKTIPNEGIKTGRFVSSGTMPKSGAWRIEDFYARTMSLSCTISKI